MAQINLPQLQPTALRHDPGCATVIHGTIDQHSVADAAELLRHNSWLPHAPPRYMIGLTAFDTLLIESWKQLSTNAWLARQTSRLFCGQVRGAYARTDACHGTEASSGRTELADSVGSLVPDGPCLQ